VLLRATSGRPWLGPLPDGSLHERLGIVGCVPDAHFEHPRLVTLYDVLHPDRRDLDPYLAMADDLGARRVLDLGCGTGTLALLLAERGVEVVGVDPAAGSEVGWRSQARRGRGTCVAATLPLPRDALHPSR
jgi:SAM-dependent methyltransferase